MYKFTLDLYKNKSDNNVLHKVLTCKYTIKGVSRADFDILTPSIIVTSAKANDYNYCYIQELHRYYYITHCVVNTDKTITLSFKVDVLMTYADDILASRGLITKQADYNPYYGDFDVEAQTEQRKIEFENAFTEEGQYILVAIRG